MRVIKREDVVLALVAFRKALMIDVVEDAGMDSVIFPGQTFSESVDDAARYLADNAEWQPDLDAIIRYNLHWRCEYAIEMTKERIEILPEEVPVQLLPGLYKNLLIDFWRIDGPDWISFKFTGRYLDGRDREDDSN